MRIFPSRHVTPSVRLTGIAGLGIHPQSAPLSVGVPWQPYWLLDTEMATVFLYQKGSEAFLALDREWSTYFDAPHPYA